MEQKRGINQIEITKYSQLDNTKVANQKLVISFEAFCQNSYAAIKASQSLHSSQDGAYDTSVSYSKNSAHQVSEKRKKSHKGGKPNGISKRKRQQDRIRKNELQIQELIVEFKVNPEWTKEKVAELSAKTGLSESQVYKWNWDQRKKFNEELDLIDGEVARDEFGGYCCKKWGKVDDFEDGNICHMLGLDIEKLALDLVKDDMEKRSKTKPIIKSNSPLKINRERTPCNQDQTLLQTPTKQTTSQLLKMQQCCSTDFTDSALKMVSTIAITPNKENKSTTADCCTSWVSFLGKSPAVPQIQENQVPFGSLSPYRFDQNTNYNQNAYSQNSYSNFFMKSPSRLFKPTPIKSPTKLFRSVWADSPLVEERENFYEQQQMRSSKSLNFGQQE